jgi:hypothetical protein
MHWYFISYPPLTILSSGKVTHTADPGSSKFRVQSSKKKSVSSTLNLEQRPVAPASRISLKTGFSQSSVTFAGEVSVDVGHQRCALFVSSRDEFDRAFEHSVHDIDVFRAGTPNTYSTSSFHK